MKLYKTVLSLLSTDPCMAKECGSSKKCSVTADEEAVCGMIYSLVMNVFLMIFVTKSRCVTRFVHVTLWEKIFVYGHIITSLVISELFQCPHTFWILSLLWMVPTV